MRLQHHFPAVLVAALLLASAASAQISPAGQTPPASQVAPATRAVKTWSRTYGGPVAEQGLHDLRQLPGGQLVVAGYTASFGGPTQWSWLMNLDTASGDVHSQRVSTSAMGGFTDGAGIAADGGALFLGRDVLDIYTKHDAWLMRVDSAGNVVWSLSFTRPGFGRHFLFDAAELADGSWVAVGATGIIDQPPQAAWIVRLTSQGVPSWHYEYGAGVTDTARSVTPTSDGGFAVAGWTNSSGAGDDDVWVMKVDANGAIQWQKTFGGVDADQAEGIVELSDDGFAVAGFTNSFTPSGHAPWVLRLDSQGSLLWHQVVADDAWGDLGAVAQTQDGNVIVVGRVAEPGFPSNDLWCAKLATTDGAVLWQRAYEGDTGDFGSAVLPLFGAGFVLGGTWGWGFPGESIWLQLTDGAGRLSGCSLMRTTTFAVTSPKLSVQDGKAIQAPGGAQIQPVGMQLAPSHADVIERCR